MIATTIQTKSAPPSGGRRRAGDCEMKTTSPNHHERTGDVLDNYSPRATT
jgi:hypothetical protein